jgi:nucleoside permease NupC
MLVQEYLHEMTPSQLFATYAGALSTVGGTSLVVFMASGVFINLYHICNCLAKMILMSNFWLD